MRRVRPTPSPRLVCTSHDSWYASPVILIVDDDQDTCVAYQDFLELLGYRAISAGTGADALAAARSTPIEAVLLDLTLPDLDGRVLCERLRAVVSPRSLPVLALTGLTLAPSEREKFTMVMRKPIDLDAVAKWLREFVPQGAAPAAEGGGDRDGDRGGDRGA